jgi:catechol 2,3-dioxygenase-like lactoylglutathione lyase family enzyme
MPQAAGALGVRKVSHVSVCVSDMARAIDFYREMFGFEVLFDDKLDGPELDRITGVTGARGRAVGGSIGGFHIELLEQSYVPDRPRPPGLGLNVLTLHVESAQAAWERAQSLGIRCETPPIDILGTRLFFILGPDDQRIELVEYPPGTKAWGGKP